ncbi:Oidioi.mRNA.OKI2018_I69.PAR.g11237.t1.cds [Oikopleura dioica]|uniref:Oidioi.mRNA.OKI2018_I69.PAR.g11237.t1.cds n=1 Tax=Oikopleura dioica TaxID=34765 RepID=A0ABN7RUT6_OIKDI|nr:Oidioi.mRNA.OKI2018_I69.PAR.g11237.t1.cds [Oikopleura dioica]
MDENDVNMPLLSPSSQSDEERGERKSEENMCKRYILTLGKQFSKHRKIIIIISCVFTFVGAFLAIFFVSFLNYHCLNLETHDVDLTASLKFYDGGSNLTLLNFPEQYNDEQNCSIGTLIGIHGYGDAYNTDWLAYTAVTFFNETENEGWCFFSMDWDEIAQYNYIASAKKVRSLGFWLSETIQKHNQIFDPSSIQIIGHSLGAHIAGFTGKEFFAATGIKISKISGLDPAGPLFQTCDDHHRLSTQDADHVLTVITNSGYLFHNGLVQSLQVGKSNLIVNGGVRQPGCGYFENACSHNRAPWAWLLNAQFGCVLEQDDGPLVDGKFFGPNKLKILLGDFTLQTREEDSLIYCDLYEDYFPP